MCPDVEGDTAEVLGVEVAGLDVAFNGYDGLSSGVGYGFEAEGEEAGFGTPAGWLFVDEGDVSEQLLLRSHNDAVSTAYFIMSSCSVMVSRCILDHSTWNSRPDISFGRGVRRSEVPRSRGFLTVWARILLRPSGKSSIG